MSQLSVILCTWNRAGQLAATLASLAQQQLPPGLALEVLVVDNNSQDETRAVVEGLRAGWTLGQLRYCFEPRQGKQFALNAGIRASSGAVLAFTDDDILFPPDWLAATWRCFAAAPELQLAGGCTRIAWPDGGAPPWYAPGMAAVLGGVDLGTARLQPPPAGYAPAGANMAARRGLFEQVGLFSEIHFRHMDYEFGLRCAAAGVAIAYDPAMEVLAPVAPGMLSKRYFRRWSFKAGFNLQRRAGEAQLLGVPRWLWRQAAQDLLCWPWQALARPAHAAFSTELRLWRAWGSLASSWYARWRPAQFSQWVERYSQKTNNLY